VAARWAAIAERPVAGANGHPAIALDNATLRFVPCRDGRPEGLGGIDVGTADRAAVLDAARQLGVLTGPDQLLLCGIRVYLV
jgi:hypothetical protein